MKIIIVHKYYYQKAGAERYVFDMAKLLMKKGHEVIPFAMHHPKNEQTPWSKYFISSIDFAHPNFFEKLRIPFRMVYSLEAKKKFRALVREVRPDIVHIHNIYHQISPSILDVCREYGIPVAQTIHDYKMICPNYMLFSNGKIDEGCKGGHYAHDIWSASVKHSYLKSALAAIEMWIHHVWLKIYEKNVQKMFMPSHFALEKYAEFGVSREKMIHLPYPIEIHQKRQDSSIAARNDSTECTILAFGRLSEEKGFDVLIRAMKDVYAHLDIIGDGPMRKKLEELVFIHGVAEKVTFHGFLPREHISAYMDRAACVVVPSIWYEVLPYSILESYAHGIPVIASRMGGMEELVKTIDPVYLFTPGNSQDCARAIAHALSDPISLIKNGEKAQRFITEECDPAAHVQTLLDGYAALLRTYARPLDKKKKNA